MFIDGTIRYCLIWTFICLGFVLAGGHLNVLWQPFELMIILGIHISLIYGYREHFKKEKTPNDIKKIKEYAWYCYLASMVIPTTLGIMHTGDYLTARTDVIGKLLAAALSALVHATTIYVSYFSGLKSSQTKTSLGLKDRGSYEN